MILMTMIIHIAFNMLFILFAFLDIKFILDKGNVEKVGSKVKNIFQVSVILGFISYCVYVFLLIKFILKDGFDKQTASLLILSWGFLFAANLLVNSKQKN